MGCDGCAWYEGRAGYAGSAGVAGRAWPAGKTGAAGCATGGDGGAGANGLSHAGGGVGLSLTMKPFRLDQGSSTVHVCQRHGRAGRGIVGRIDDGPGTRAAGPEQECPHER